MWFMEPRAFVSIVEKPEDIGQGTLTVRARDKRSLKAFMDIALEQDTPLKSIKFKMATDYPYRVVVTREQAARYAVDCVERIRYANFKDEAKRVRGADFAQALSAVWTAMLRLEDAATRRAMNKRWASQAKGSKGKGSKGASGGGYGSLYTGVDNWPSIFATTDTPVIPNDDEYERLCELVAASGIQSLTDEEYAFYDAYEHG